MKIVYESSYKKTPVYGDTLMHWKYIKRERKNGRWVYYYNDSEYQDAKKKHDAYKKGYERARMNMIASQANVVANERLYEENGHARQTKEAIQRHKVKAFEYARNYELAGERYVKVKKEYQAVKIKTLVPRIIAKGAVKIANLLSKLTPKKKK